MNSTVETQKDSQIKATRLRKRIAANERLLSIYNPPFPDEWERRKRAELIADIIEAQRQLDEITSIQ